MSGKPNNNRSVGRGRGAPSATGQPAARAITAPGERPTSSQLLHQAQSTATRGTAPLSPATSAIPPPAPSSINVGASSEPVRRMQPADQDEIVDLVSQNNQKIHPLSRPVAADGRLVYVNLPNCRRIRIFVNHFEMTVLDEKNAVRIYFYDVDIEEQQTKAQAEAARNNKRDSKKIISKSKKMAMMKEAFERHRDFFNGRRFGYDAEKNLYTTTELAGGELRLTDPEVPSREFVLKINSMVKSFTVRELFEQVQSSGDRLPEMLAAFGTMLMTPLRWQYKTGGNLFCNLLNQAKQVDLSPTKAMADGFYAAAKPGEWTLTLLVDPAKCVVMKPKPVVEYWKSLPTSFQLQKKCAKLTEMLEGLKVRVAYGTGKSERKWDKAFVRCCKWTANNCPDFDVIGYYRTQYDVEITMPELPLIQVAPREKKIYYPMEFCTVREGQRSTSSLERDERAQLVVACSTRADVRFRSTKELLRTDLFTPPMKEFLQQLGVKLDPTPMGIEALVLPQLSIEVFNRAVVTCDPERFTFALGPQHKFYQPAKFGKWAYCVSAKVPSNIQITPEDWLRDFTRTASQRGLAVGRHSFYQTASTKPEIDNFFKECEAAKIEFAILFVDENTELYYFIKQHGDRSLKMVTQCVAVTHLAGKRMPDRPDKSVVDNVLLKANVKLGGVNFVVNGMPGVDVPIFREDVLVVGADVTHPKPGDKTTPSLAAICGSINPSATMYKSFIKVQSHRQEWIEGLDEAIEQLLLAYDYNNNKRKPTRIIFLRDGVSEGQYDAVLHSELFNIQKAIKNLEKTDKPQISITYVVVRKRIQTKIYPADRNDAAGKHNNVPPGTLVEHVITQPKRYFDWFMVPHLAIQGTARPSHYVVLYDDSKFTPTVLASMMFIFCHLHQRSLRATSLPSPVFHAHLAAKRAAQHLLGGKLIAGESEGTLEEQRLHMTNLARKWVEMDTKAKANYWL